MSARALLIFLTALLVVFAVYRRSPSHFLRAESGSYLILSHSDAQTRRASEIELVRYSFNGHYTPLAFLAEFRIARLIGTNGKIWRARQIIVLALVAAGVFAFGRFVAGVFGVSASAASATAAALAASVAFQPQMFDFISWPFMILQLLWIGLALLVVSALLRFVAEPAAGRWLWIAAGAAYGSMHVSGLGLVLVGATAIVLGGILFIARRSGSPDFRPNTRLVSAALVAMLSLGAVHSGAMLLLEYGPPSPTPANASLDAARYFLGFFWQFAIAGLTSFLPAAVASTNGPTLAYLWPAGVLLLGALTWALAALAARASVRPDRERLACFVLHAFSISAFCVLALLVVLRLRGVPAEELGDKLGNYTWGPRYVIPLHTTMLGSFAVLVASIGRRAPRAAAVGFSALAITAIVAQAEFQQRAARHLGPAASISHDAAWQLVLAAARECRAQNLPIPDVPLSALAQEFTETTLRSVEPLLRHDLKLRDGEAIEMIPWQEYTAAGRQRYRTVPALKRLERKLGLLPSRKS